MALSNRIQLARLDLQDALDLAILIETEARERYREFADLIGDRYAGDAAAFFETMQRNEEKHRHQLDIRRRALFGDAPVRVELDDIADVEAPEYRAARNYMGTRQALEVALRAEAKAWTFFDEALRQVSDPSVRELFAELRAEEAEHAALVQAMLSKIADDDGADRDIDEVDTPPL